MKQALSRIAAGISAVPYRLLDMLYRPMDRRRVLRTNNLDLIPGAADRRGGKYAYVEWAHVIGVFQSLMHSHLARRDGVALTGGGCRVLDIGCGTGLVGIAAQHLVADGGKYVGLEIQKQNIDFCRAHYAGWPNYQFVQFDVHNPAYRSADGNKAPWPLDDGAFDLVTALSVWTHLRQEDATFYMKEVSRVLAPGGKAIITFFVLDEQYNSSVAGRDDKPGRFHRTAKSMWVFDTPAYGSKDWLSPRWAHIPEQAVGVRPKALEAMLADAGMRLVEMHPGKWREVPGLYFQDVLVLQKTR